MRNYLGESVKVFSVVDWKYHRGKVSWDDLFNEDGLLVATVATMKFAKEDGLFSSEWLGEFPKRIITHDSDGSYTIYENEPILTKQIIQRMLNDLGKLRQKRFLFIPNKLPRKLPKLYSKVVKSAKIYKNKS